MEDFQDGFLYAKLTTVDLIADDQTRWRDLITGDEKICSHSTNDRNGISNTTGIKVYTEDATTVT